jgi:hypothetical protein
LASHASGSSFLGKQCLLPVVTTSKFDAFDLLIRATDHLLSVAFVAANVKENSRLVISK